MITRTPSKSPLLNQGTVTNPWLNWFSEIGVNLEGDWGKRDQTPQTTGISGDLTQNIINLGVSAYYYNLTGDGLTLNNAVVVLPYKVLKTIVQVYNGTTLFETIEAEGEQFNISDGSIDLRIQALFIRG